MATPRLRLGQLLVDAKLITPADLEAVLEHQKADGRRLGTLLVERGLVNETQLTQILSHQLSVPWVSLLHIEFSRQLLNLVPHDVAERYCLVPIYVRHVRNQGETLYVAMDDPSNDEALRACSEHAGLPARAMIAPPQDIRSAIRVYYGVAPRPPSQPAPALDDGSGPAAAAPPAPPVPQVEEASASAPATVPVPTEPVPTTRLAPPAPPVILPAIPEVPETPPEIPKPPEPEAVVEPPPPSRRVETEAPEIVAVEIELKPRSTGRPARAASEPPPASERGSPSERPVTTIPRPRGRAPRMVSLTLLDGTTLSLPAKPRHEAEAPEEEPVQPAASSDLQVLTARDLVEALRAVAQGADGTEILGRDHRWESMFAALLSILLKKHLIADWEFVDELKRMG